MMCSSVKSFFSLCASAKRKTHFFSVWLCGFVVFLLLLGGVLGFLLVFWGCLYIYYAF